MECNRQTFLSFYPTNNLKSQNFEKITVRTPHKGGMRFFKNGCHVVGGGGWEIFARNGWEGGKPGMGGGGL